MSIFVRIKRSSLSVKRSVILTGTAVALVAGTLVAGGASPATAQPAAGDTSLGAVTAFAADSSTYTLSAGTAKVRVVFLKNDVFRIWLAPDGTFTDPANTPPTDPGALVP